MSKGNIATTDISSTFSLVIDMMHKDSPDMITLCVFCSGATNTYLAEIVK